MRRTQGRVPVIVKRSRPKSPIKKPAKQKPKHETTASAKKESKPPVEPPPKKTKKSKNVKVPPEFMIEVTPKIEALLPPETPYKIGIHKDIFSLLKEEYDGQLTRLYRSIGLCLRYKTLQDRYLQSVVRGQFRYGMNSDKHDISPDHRNYSKYRLKLNSKSKKPTGGKKNGNGGAVQKMRRGAVPARSRQADIPGASGQRTGYDRNRVSQHP